MFKDVQFKRRAIRWHYSVPEPRNSLLRRTIAECIGMHIALLQQKESVLAVVSRQVQQCVGCWAFACHISAG